MTDWQPIATAPRDGTKILCCGTSLEDGQTVVGICCWFSETHEWWDQVDDTTKKLARAEYGRWDGDTIEPRHWMPLPEPPKED